jgi:hypothetical protein
MLESGGDGAQSTMVMARSVLLLSGYSGETVRACELTSAWRGSAHREADVLRPEDLCRQHVRPGRGRDGKVEVAERAHDDARVGHERSINPDVGAVVDAFEYECGGLGGVTCEQMADGGRALVPVARRRW